MSDNKNIDLNKEQLDCVTGGIAESTGTEEKIYQIIADYMDLKPITADKADIEAIVARFTLSLVN